MSGIIGVAGSKSGILGRSKDTAKAWMSFDADDVITYDGLDSFSGVNDDGAHYVVLWSEAQPNALYDVQAINMDGGSKIVSVYAKGTTAFRVYNYSDSGSTEDGPIMLLVHGD